jgi:hypothetical protein
MTGRDGWRTHAIGEAEPARRRGLSPLARPRTARQIGKARFQDLATASYAGPKVRY